MKSIYNNMLTLIWCCAASNHSSVSTNISFLNATHLPDRCACARGITVFILSVCYHKSAAYIIYIIIIILLLLWWCYGYHSEISTSCTLGSIHAVKHIFSVGTNTPVSLLPSSNWYCNVSSKQQSPILGLQQKPYAPVLLSRLACVAIN